MLRTTEDTVIAHYSTEGLIDAIRRGLDALGIALEDLDPEDLAPVDEFHTGGRLTTLKALELVPMVPGLHVLDAGCGLGGTARHLASEHGCRVTGLDLTPAYVEVARILTEWTGLADACTFEQGSVLDMPFADGDFDAAVTFHVAMNVEDRRRFYDELARVLRPGSCLCIFDVMKGPEPGMVYPVPWAESEVTSFLFTAARTRELLQDAGFQITVEANLREMALDYFRDAMAKAAAAGAPPPLGLHLLTRENSKLKFANYVQALQSRQVEPIVVAATRG